MPDQINLNDIQLKLVNKHREDFDEVSQETKVYDIMLGGKKIGKIETYHNSFGMNYVSQFKISPQLRSKGIGSFVLKKFFKGYFISAGNPRVRSLYNRIGKGQDKFTGKENKILAQSTGMWGTWRIK